jgi:hypothetical protein
VADACRRWPGVSRARTVAAFADSRAASPLESISRVAFHDYQLPPPILQAIIGGYEEADFLWPDCRVIGEADGLSKYTSPEVLRREKEREEGSSSWGSRFSAGPGGTRTAGRTPWHTARSRSSSAAATAPDPRDLGGQRAIMRTDKSDIPGRPIAPCPPKSEWEAGVSGLEQ